MNIYFNERLIKSNVEDPKEVQKIINEYLEQKGIKNDSYQRWVGLDNDKTMVDFGSWSNFFYIDCPVEEFFKYDETRDIQNNKREKP